MTYIIIELQTNIEGPTVNIVQTAASENQADSIYHSILASAAISSVYCHAVTMLSSDGEFIKKECYWHVPESEEETTPES